MLLKNITIFVLLVVIHSEEQDIEDSNIEELSEFFVKLISQYDKEGKGFIKRLDYPYFIRDVFIQGSKLEETTSPLV